MSIPHGRVRGEEFLKVARKLRRGISLVRNADFCDFDGILILFS